MPKHLTEDDAGTAIAGLVAGKVPPENIEIDPAIIAQAVEDYLTDNPPGGVKNVTLTAAQSGLPEHSHAVTDPGHSHTADVYATDANGNFFDRTAGGGAAGVATTHSATTDITIQNAGPANASSAHTNLQPYIAVYMFKRTA